MTTLTPIYGSVVTLTYTLASLASDSSLIAGRESNAADNTVDLADDSVVGGKITTGTSPSAGSWIEVWAIGSYDGVTFTNSATGSDANFSPTSKSILFPLLIIPVTSSSNVTYAWGPFSVASAFGGTMPRKWSIFVVQNTGANLNATGSNFELKYTPVKYQVA